MQRGGQCPRYNRRLSLLTLNYLDAGLVAGPAAFSSLAGVLFAGFASFLTSALATGAEAAGAGVAGALAGSAAKADTANAAITARISLFILFSFKVS
jgi:hypothetical protein